ncbi:MAG: biotin/lipoyl-binding protein [Victivallaceae bacterium]|nr:biotin/lipoyl-binding protein [Victivallaceae bacterium]
MMQKLVSFVRGHGAAVKKVLIATVAAVSFVLLCLAAFRGGSSVPAPEGSRRIIGVGYARGAEMITLKNKYAGFVSKVNFYTGDAVKKGDVILEFDDYEWRVALEKAMNAVTEQRKTVEAKSAALQLTRVDPLPSQYRNLKWKSMAAQERFKRLQHETDVYRHLHGNSIVSDLSYREKIQDMRDAEADFKSYANDIQLVENGLDKLYIAAAQKELEVAEAGLADLERILELVREEGKYYRFVAPFDGIVENHSDTVHGYNAAGSAIAEIHDYTQGTKVYCYFDERDVGFVTVGETYRFRTNQFDCDKLGFPMVKPTRVKKSHSSFGDRSLYLVQCVLVSSPRPLNINSAGQMEIDVPAGR